MIRSLDKKWKEFIFALSGFGPNLLMVLMGAYFTDAINPAAVGSDYQTIMSGVCFILPALFPILYAVAKAFDGIIDIPFAHITDTLSTKWGRRRPAILVCAIPMIISYALCWMPIFGENNQLANTIWIIFWALIFFSTYTMCLIAYYGSFSTVCSDEPQRLRVSGYKSFADTISYCLVYALVPVILEGAQIHIDKLVFLLLPLMLTIAIPLFMIKEGAKYGYPENEGLKPEKITIKESMKLTFKNKIFVRWLVVNCCTYFGLQMFLSSMNTLITGGMGFSGLEMTILNTCAFAPVPIMLYLFNKLKAKKGIRFTYQTCLIAFAVGLLAFFFGSKFMIPNNRMLQIIIGCTGSIIGSWAIGAFFMMPYHITAQISSVEEKLTGKNHSAMYFAANAVATSIAGAISGSLVYDTIKNFFFVKGGMPVWVDGSTNLDAALEAVFGAGAVTYNLAWIAIPFIVAFFCVLGAIIARKMPKDYTADLVIEEFKKLDPTLEVTEETSAQFAVKEEKGEIIFVQVGLSILSGFIFGFIWLGYLLKSIKELLGKKMNRLLWWLGSCFVPFFSIFTLVKMDNELKAKSLELGKNYKSAKGWFIVTAILFPILPVNVISLAIMQSKVNALYLENETDK